MVFIENKNIAPPKKCHLPVAKPKPAVHNGGINAVAIATPDIVVIAFERLLNAIIKAKPPAKAIITSRTSGAVLAINSGVSF